MENMIIFIGLIYLDLLFIMFYQNISQLSYIGSNKIIIEFLFFYVKDNTWSPSYKKKTQSENDIEYFFIAKQQNNTNQNFAVEIEL